MAHVDELGSEGVNVGGFDAEPGGFFVSAEGEKLVFAGMQNFVNVDGAHGARRTSGRRCKSPGSRWFPSVLRYLLRC